MRVTGIVMAGGLSSRMGKNKALVKYKHKRLIDIATKTIYPICDYILISSNEHLPNVPFTMVRDEHSNIGPIGGLYAALKKSQTTDNIVIACDMPLVDIELLDDLLEKSKGYEAVIPRLPNGKLEPLVAYYSKDILPIIEQHILDENYKLVNLIFKLNVKYIEMRDDWRFKNINTPEDIQD